MKNKIKILVISNTPWSDYNSFGNSYSNIFGGMTDFEFANIFCRYGEPKNDLVHKYFQITEKSLLKNLLNPSVNPGKEINSIKDSIKLNPRESNVFDFARKNRWEIFFTFRNLIWEIGRWDSKELKDFVDDFNPDIIFQQIYKSTFVNRIGLFLHIHTKKPMICYVSDDVYVMKQNSVSPLAWINKMVIRKRVKEIFSYTNILYVISNNQKKEYDSIFNINTKILTKGADFNLRPEYTFKKSFPINLVYTGNLGDGRWRSLSLISKAISKLNEKKEFFKLTICTMTPLSKKMKKSILQNNSVKLLSNLPIEEVKTLQQNSDILIHAESFLSKENLLYRLSFSTKIVDYFESGKCILAIGTKGISTMDYLIENDAAIIATSYEMLIEQLNRILENPEIIQTYAKKGWDCGKRNHQISDIQSMLKSDINSLVQGEKN